MPQRELGRFLGFLVAKERKENRFVTTRNEGRHDFAGLPVILRAMEKPTILENILGTCSELASKKQIHADGVLDGAFNIYIYIHTHIIFTPILGEMIQTD